MDRARDFHFVKQLPRHDLPQVGFEEQVYDHQVLLNETWLSYATRRSYGAERAGEDHVKWVTETWAQYEARCIQRDAALNKYFGAQRRLESQRKQREADRFAAAEAVVADLSRGEGAKADARHQPLHTLLLDFEEMMQERMRQERSDLEAQEQLYRGAVAREEEEARRVFEQLAAESLERVLGVLEAQRQSKEAQEQRVREDQQRKADERRAAEERRKREADEAERRKREAEEEARRAERKRKDEERKAKARAEREARNAAAKGAKAHSQKEQQQPQQPQDQQQPKWKAARAARLARQNTDMAAYLEMLQQRAAAVGTTEDLQGLYAAVVTELGGGSVLFHTAVYMGLPSAAGEDNALTYEYASQNCSSKLRGGSATLVAPSSTGDDSSNATLPLTLKKCVAEGSATGVVHHCMDTLVNVGDLPAPQSDGDFFAVPITAASARVVAVLACDTLQGNAQDDASTLHPGEEDCYNLGADGSLAGGGEGGAAEGDATVPISDQVVGFMSQVASILSEAATLVEREQQQQVDGGKRSVAFPDTFPSVHSLFTFATNAAFSVQDRADGDDPASSGIQGYISRNNCSNGSECTIVAHNGVSISDPARHSITDRPCHLLGLSLAQDSGCLSLNDLRAKAAATALKLPPAPKGQRAIDAASDEEIVQSCAHELVQSVAADARCKTYVSGAGKSPSEALLLAPILNEKQEHIVTMGFSGDAALFQDPSAIAAMLRIVLKTREALLPLLVDLAVQEMCQQALEWVTNTTGCSNAYVSLFQRGARAGDAASALTYVAATPPQQWLVGRTLDPAAQDVFSYKLVHQSLDEQKPLLANVPSVKDAPNVLLHNDAFADRSAVEGSLIAKPIGTCAGDIQGVLYADTVKSAGSCKKKVFEKGDEEMINITAQLLGELLNETRDGKPLSSAVAAGSDSKKLHIEKDAGEERIKFLKLVWLKITSDVKAITNNQLQEMKSYNSPPPVIPMSSSAMFIVLGTKPKSVEKWEDTRGKITMKLLDKIAAFDPTSPKTKKAFFLRAKRMTKGYTAHDIFTKGSYPASCFFTWTFVTILLRSASDRLRKKIKEGTLWNEDTSAQQLHDGMSSVGADTEALNEEGLDDLGDDDGDDDVAADEGDG